MPLFRLQIHFPNSLYCFIKFNKCFLSHPICRYLGCKCIFPIPRFRLFFQSPPMAFQDFHCKSFVLSLLLFVYCWLFMYFVFFVNNFQSSPGFPLQIICSLTLIICYWNCNLKLYSSKVYFSQLWICRKRWKSNKLGLCWEAAVHVNM